MDGKAVERIPISILCTTQKTQYPIGPLTFLSLRIIFPLWLHNSCTASVHTLENKNCFTVAAHNALKKRQNINKNPIRCVLLAAHLHTAIRV